MSFGNVLRELRNKKESTGEELGKVFNVSKATISNWESGNRTPDNEMLIKIANYFDVSIDYLVDRTYKKGNETKAVRVNVYGTVPAGVPISAWEDIIDWEEIPQEMTRGGKEYIGLVVRGDSMEPDYLDGDVVLVLLQPDCETGDHCIVFVDGDNATFKKVVKKDSGILMLQALNTKYDPILFTPKEILDLPVRILGVVVELRRKKRKWLWTYRGI